MNISLQILIKDSIAGREPAQRALYMKYRIKWYMQCLRYGKNKHEADDMMQEGLIQIFKDLHQFDAKRSSFETWTSRLISHAALRYLKKNSWNNAFAEIDEANDLSESSETIHEKLAAKELTLLIQSLPMGYRVVFNLFLEGFSHQEIAERLDITIGTSKSQLFKAKRMLRKKLKFHLTSTNR